MDLPVFDGTNPDGWILRAERYFSFYRLSEEERLEAAIVGFDGDALAWYQWEHNRRPIRHWDDMRNLILKQFRPLHSGSLCEQWLVVSQTGIVSNFRRKFIELAAPLDKIPEPILLAHFINGLREDIRAEVRMLGLHSLEQAMDLALKVNETNRLRAVKLGGCKAQSPTFKSSFSNQFLVHFKSQNQSYNDPFSSNGTKISAISSNSGTGSSSPIRWSSNNTNANQTESQTINSGKSYIPIANPVGEVRRLMDKELQYKRERGLCFRYDDKWVAGHRCRRKELSVLLAQEEEDEDINGEVEVQIRGDENTETSAAEVSLNSMVGLTTPKTMKLVGKIGEQEVIVMVDPGATHNFISLSTVKKSGIPISNKKGFGVSLGNGVAVQGTGECKSVLLRLDGVDVVEDFLPFELGNSDVILGV